MCNIPSSSICKLLILLTVAAAGCQSNKPTQREQAHQRWSQARAAVLGTLAQRQYETANFDQSRQTVNDAIKLHATSAPLRILSAKLAIEQGQLELAERELTVARQLDPKSAEAEYLSGVIYQRWQRPQLAYEFYDRASAKAPAELAYLMARAEMLVAMDRAPEALALLQEKVVYFEQSAVIRDAVGQLLGQQDRPGDAIAMFRQATILRPDEPVFREHFALALYQDRQYGTCVDQLSRLLKEAGYAERADLRTALGESQAQLGRWRDARASFEEASRLDPSNPRVLLGLGKSALQLNDFARAEMALRKCLALAPRDPEALLMHGYLRLRQNRFEEAIGAFTRASALDRDDTMSLCMIGYAHEKAGHADQALYYYGRALRLAPHDELARSLMASLAQ